MGSVELFWALHQPGLRDWALLRAYLSRASEREVWLFLRLLSGHYWYPQVPPVTLIRIAARLTALPRELLLQSMREAGDAAEALTLILIPPDRGPTGFPENLSHWFVHQLPALLRSEEHLIASLPALWRTLCQKEAFFLHKVLLHSAHLPAFRRPAFLLSFLRQRWSFPEKLLLSHLRSYLEPPDNAFMPTLF